MAKVNKVGGIPLTWDQLKADAISSKGDEGTGIRFADAMAQIKKIRESDAKKYGREDPKQERFREISDGKERRDRSSIRYPEDSI